VEKDVSGEHVRANQSAAANPTLSLALPSSHSAGHRCPAEPCPSLAFFQLGQCEQGPRRPTAKAVAHWAASRSPSKRTVSVPGYKHGDGHRDWGGKVGRGRCGTREGIVAVCRAGKPKPPAAGRPAKSPALSWAAFLPNSLGSRRVKGAEASLACYRRVSPAAVNIENNTPTLAHRTSYLTTSGASDDRVVASAPDQTVSFSQDREASKAVTDGRVALSLGHCSFRTWRGHTASFSSARHRETGIICSTRSQLLNLKSSTAYCTGMLTHWPRK
jgi:hypothetical protein